MTPKNEVLAVRPNAVLMHVPLSMAVAVYDNGRMIGSEAVDAEMAWTSAYRVLSEQEHQEPKP